MKGWGGAVAEEEKLFRRVRQTVAGQICYQTDGERVNFSQAAFNDPAREPSVDRAALRVGPHQSRWDAEDGIVTLQAAAIRKIGSIARVNEKNKPLKDDQGLPMHYVISVVSDPKFGNCSHALVIPDPVMGSGAFKRLKDALARLATEAGWTVQPNTPVEGPWENALQDSMRCLRHRLARRSQPT